MSLTSSVNSEYVNIANAMHARLPEILIYVEDELDSIFWHEFVKKYQAKCKFTITPVYNKDVGEIDATLKCGKCAIFKYYLNGVGPNLWICIDSDYDELIPDYPNSFPQSLKCPFVIRTGVYAIENLKCRGVTLSDIVYKATAVSAFDVQLLEQIFNEFSLFLYDILPIHLAHMELKRNEFGQGKLKETINRVSYSRSNTIEDFKVIIEREKNEITRLFADFIANNKNLIENYTQKLYDVCKEDSSNAFYFMNGHDLEEYIVKLLFEFCEPARYKKFGQIQHFKNEKDKQQYTNKYLNETFTKEGNGGLKGRLHQLVADNLSFHDCIYANDIQNRIDSAYAWSLKLWLISAIKQSHKKENLPEGRELPTKETIGRKRISNIVAGG